MTLRSDGSWKLLSSWAINTCRWNVVILVALGAGRTPCQAPIERADSSLIFLVGLHLQRCLTC